MNLTKTNRRRKQLRQRIYWSVRVHVGEDGWVDTCYGGRTYRQAKEALRKVRKAEPNRRWHLQKQQWTPTIEDMDYPEEFYRCFPRGWQDYTRRSRNARYQE